MMNKFEVKNMDLYYGSFHALKNVNLNIASVLPAAASLLF